MKSIGKKLEKLMQNNFACITFLFLFCFASFGLPLLWGLPSGYDMVTDIRFASALKDAMLAGDFFPGWANDNFGFGIRLNIPRLGPLRLDYGIPITHDKDSSGNGRFQFSVGFRRQY